MGTIIRLDGITKIWEIANENDAIDTVMFTDNFLRKISLTNRKKFSKTIKDLKLKGCKVYKMSSLHVSGEKIDSFGGIVGILTYVVPEISDLGVEDLEIKDENDDKSGVDEFNENNNEILQKLIKDNENKYNENEDEDIKEEDDDGEGKKNKNKNIKNNKNNDDDNDENDED